MGALVWVMVGLAIWHFAVFIPDKAWGGIVGAFVGACVGSLLIGYLINGLSVPSNSEMDLMTAVQGVPGALVGIGVMYFIGSRQERLAEEARGGLASH